MNKVKDRIIVQNKKAFHDYYIEDTYECGIVLTGTEIKSIRQGTVNLNDSYCYIKLNEAYVSNMHISEYAKGNIFNHDPKRTRKLLLSKREIIKISQYVQRDGYTLVPLNVHLTHGLAKIDVGLARGKKNYDKKEALKEKVIDKESLKYR